MDFILDIIEQNQVYIIIGLVVLSIVFLIIAIVNSAKCSSLKKKYDAFMQGKDGKSLEDDILFRLEQIDELIESNAANEMPLMRWVENYHLHLQCLMREMMDMFLMWYTAERVALVM